MRLSPNGWPFDFFVADAGQRGSDYEILRGPPEALCTGGCDQGEFINILTKRWGGAVDPGERVCGRRVV